jgi:enoyl-CoA hydratase/carnithine racemase
MGYEYIETSREDALAVITMARPEKRNALSEAHLRELLEAFEGAGRSDARGVILAARGPVFSAGHDFSDMDGRDIEAMRQLLDVCAQVMSTIQTLPQPVIAQVEGLATAAGCQLVATCDLAVAGASSRFAVPGGRGGWFCTTPGVALARAVGRKHAVEMLLTGDPIDAPTAEAWGLVNRVVPNESVAEETRALLRRATRGSTASKAIGKRAVYHQIDLTTPEAYAYATEVMAGASQTPDAQEGLRSFLEKRRPHFTDGG